ncbi:hypothetical protein K438DRAFT_1977092 [Mycena galopus ATCC 62051]|nr:hypothetical protein K438DRAFT_1977092 [Mycena galopus ATCC 62051]
MLDLAEYWTCVNENRAEDIKSALENIRLKIMRVKFTIFSRDQAWCDDAALRGTYRGFAWFEAGILGPRQFHATSTPAVGSPALEVEVEAEEGGRRWKVQADYCASREYREHVVWDADGASTPGDENYPIARARYSGMG